MKQFIGLKQLLSKIKWLITLLLLVAAIGSSIVAEAQFDGGVEDLPVVKVIGTANGGLITLGNGATVDNTFQPGYEKN